MMDEVLRGKPGYEWTVNHVLRSRPRVCTVRLEEWADDDRGPWWSWPRRSAEERRRGPDHLRCDSRDRESYELVRKSGALTPETVARLYGIRASG